MKQKKQVEKNNQEENMSRWQLIKAIWRNPRYRALIKLIGYGVFIAIILLLLQSQSINSNTQTSNSNFLTRYGNMDNYEYQYTLTVNQNKQFASGIRMNQKQTFYVNNTETQFLYEDDTYYKVENDQFVTTENPLFYSLKEIDPKNLEILLKAATKISTTKYESGSYEYIYQLPISQYNQTIESDTPIKIKVLLEKNKVTSVIIDFTEYEQSKNSDVIKYELKLEYFHIGEMKEL